MYTLDAYFNRYYYRFNGILSMFNDSGSRWQVYKDGSLYTTIEK